MDQEKINTPQETPRSLEEIANVKRQKEAQKKKEEEDKIVNEIESLRAKQKELELLLTNFKEAYNKLAESRSSAREKREILKATLAKLSDVQFTIEELKESSQMQALQEAKTNLHTEIDNLKTSKGKIQSEIPSLTEKKKTATIPLKTGEKKEILPTKDEIISAIENQIAEIEKQIQELEAQTPEGQAKIREEVKKNILARHKDRHYGVLDNLDRLHLVYPEDLVDGEEYGETATKQILVKFFNQRVDEEKELAKKNQDLDILEQDLETIENLPNKYQTAIDAVANLKKQRQGAINYLNNIIEQQPSVREDLRKFCGYKWGDEEVAERYIDHIISIEDVGLRNHLTKLEEIIKKIQDTRQCLAKNKNAVYSFSKGGEWYDNKKQQAQHSTSLIDPDYVINYVNIFSEALTKFTETVKTENLQDTVLAWVKEKEKYRKFADIIYPKNLTEIAREVKTISINKKTYEKLEIGYYTTVLNDVEQAIVRIDAEAQKVKNKLPKKIDLDWSSQQVQYFTEKYPDLIRNFTAILNQKEKIATEILPQIESLKKELKDLLNEEIKVDEFKSYYVEQDKYRVDLPKHDEIHKIRSQIDKDLPDTISALYAELNKIKLPLLFGRHEAQKKKESIQQKIDENKNKKDELEKKIKELSKLNVEQDNRIRPLWSLLTIGNAGKDFIGQTLTIQHLFNQLKVNYEKNKNITQDEYLAKYFPEEQLKLYNDYQIIKNRYEEAEKNYYQNQKK